MLIAVIVAYLVIIRRQGMNRHGDIGKISIVSLLDIVHKEETRQISFCRSDGTLLVGADHVDLCVVWVLVQDLIVA